MYTPSMETIYLSMRAQVAVGTFFMKSLGVFQCVVCTAESISYKGCNLFDPNFSPRGPPYWNDTNKWTE